MEGSRHTAYSDKMIRLLIIPLLLVLITSFDTLAQKEDYIWFLGKDQSAEPGVQGMMWDWNKRNPVPIRQDLAYGIDNNNISICDKDGNLLFWSNGCAVINRNQEVMPNGDTLNWDPFREVVGWRECTRGYPVTQSIKVLTDPSNLDGFYIFHKANRYKGQFEEITMDLRVTYVDLTLNGGLGDVVYYDSIIYDAPVTMANLEAISTREQDSWWILQPAEDESFIIRIKLDDNGLGDIHFLETDITFEKFRSGAGTMRFSPDGAKLAYYNYFKNLHVYDFDRSTGQISNHQKVTIFDDAEQKPNNQFRFGSVEWSPNSRFMYVAVSDSLFQVDSWEADMDDGIRLIDVWNGTLDPFPTTFYVASLAPDCKIYICSTSGSRSYHIIHKPDELGTACNFVQNGLKLPQAAGSANLPLHPRWRVDEEDKCDPTITSVFGAEVWYKRDLQVYPSPTYGPLTVELPEDVPDGQLKIIDLQGRVIFEKELDPHEKKISLDLSAEQQGHYHVELYPLRHSERIYYGQQILLIK